MGEGLADEDVVMSEEGWPHPNPSPCEERGSSSLRDEGLASGLRASPKGQGAGVGLLALLQLTDSGFPSGAFTQSYGLEQLARERRVVTPGEVEAFVTGVLRQSVSTADARSAYAGAVAAGLGDVEWIVAIDKALFRTKAAPELRAACVSTGRRLIEETSVHLEDETLGRYAIEVRAGRSPGTHAVAFGVAAAAMGVDAADVPSALMMGTASAMLQASMRMLPVSHRDVQAALHRLRGAIGSMGAEVVEEIGKLEALENEDPGLNPRATPVGMPVLLSFAPLQEIASMRHARASARQFAS